MSVIEGMAKTVCEVTCAAHCDKPCWMLDGCSVEACEGVPTCGQVARAVGLYLADPQNITWPFGVVVTAAKCWWRLSFPTSHTEGK